MQQGKIDYPKIICSILTFVFLAVFLTLFIGFSYYPRSSLFQYMAFIASLTMAFTAFFGATGALKGTKQELTGAAAIFFILCGVISFINAFFPPVCQCKVNYKLKGEWEYTSYTYYEVPDDNEKTYERYNHAGTCTIKQDGRYYKFEGKRSCTKSIKINSKTLDKVKIDLNKEGLCQYVDTVINILQNKEIRDKKIDNSEKKIFEKVEQLKCIDNSNTNHCESIKSAIEKIKSVIKKNIIDEIKEGDREEEYKWKSIFLFISPDCELVFNYRIWDRIDNNEYEGHCHLFLDGEGPDIKKMTGQFYQLAPSQRFGYIEFSRKKAQYCK
jgi:hypothetical protein